MTRPALPPIAVIGMSARFPHAPDIAAFWRLLDEGRDAVTVVPAERWDAEELYDATPGRRGKMTTRWGAFIDDVRGFDAAFFGISPREARDMDPQQRLLLEVAWATFESAGYAAERIAGSATGVFIGIGANDFSQLQFARPDHRSTISAYSGTGQAHSIGPNRISYAFDLRGPSLAIDTACSSSLVALHQAVRSLAAGESSMALAGGVSLVLAPEISIAFSHAQMLAADGRCKSFDARADGYVRGEGCGLVLLKPLADALRDGDPVYGVIAGSAINQDGRSNGLTAPNGRAQADVVRRALEVAAIGPERIGYIEAHGTGTPLGDPIELNALATVLERPATFAPTVVGSVKTNIGHLECASGIAGFLKALLALRNERIPANLHFEQLNPAIALGSGLRIAAAPTPWERNGVQRYAGISSYGFGGSNAHVVITETPTPVPAPADERKWHVVAMSAKTEPALARAAEALRDALGADDSLADIAFTSTAGRSHFGYRYAAVVKSKSDLLDELDAIVDGRPSARVHVRSQADFARPRVGFLFTGQGSQYVGMGRELYATSAHYREAFDRCARILDPLLDEPLAALLAGAGTPGALDRTGNTQPALFALEYALAMTWIAWGIVPHALLGHSVGEFAAAAVGGMLTLEAAGRLVVQRARLMQALPAGGAMAALLEPAAAVEARVAPYAAQVSIAARNGPASIVISGHAPAVEAIVARATADGVSVQRLNVSHAFHSPLMEPMLDAFEAEAARVRAGIPHITTLSNVTGRPHTTAPESTYWRRQAREPVAFAGGVEALIAAGCDVLLEVGPDATLSGLAKRAAGTAAGAVVPSLRKGRAAWRTLGDAAATLYTRNAPIDWRGMYRDQGRQIAALPSYPFEHQRYWFSDEAVPLAERDEHADAAPTGHPLLGRRIAAASPLFCATLALDRLPFLRDHQIEGRVMLPASAYVELAFAAAAATRPAERYELANLVLRRPLVLEETQPAVIQTALHATPLGDEQVEIHSRSGEDWTLLATATLRRHAASGAVRVRADSDAAIDGEAIGGADLYARLQQVGYGYGPAFAGVVKVERAAGRARGTVSVPALLRVAGSPYGFHPAILDACFHVAAATAIDEGQLFIPASIDAVSVYGTPSNELRVFAHQRAEADAGGIIVDLTIENADGAAVAAVSGLRAQRMGREKPAERGPAAAPMYDVAWSPLTIDAAARTRRCSVIAAGPRGERVADALRALGWSVSSARAADTRGGDVLVMAGALDRSDDALAFEVLEAARRALASRGTQLVVITAGAQKISPDDVVAPAAGAVWGAARTVAREHPELGTILLDLSFAGADGEAQVAARVISAARPREEVALRAGVLLRASLVARTAAKHKGAARVPAGPYQLRSTQRGRLDGVRAVAVAAPLAGPGQIVIEVSAAALNFRDVMKTLGMYPQSRPDGNWLGDECAGTVVALGAGVAQFTCGDRVVAYAPAAFGRYAVTQALLAAPVPVQIDSVTAAALPVAYGTSWYALTELARVRPGERVLIHAAAGGVGLAAVAVAQSLGAEVYATAGSDEKRAYLRALGVEAIFDSRSLDFAQAIRERTGGAGVDVVLNSLAGDALTATLSIVAPFGRFIEIGKKDIYANSPLPMRPLARNVSFFALDMDELLEQRPEIGSALLYALLAGIADGRLPRLPVTTFGLGEAERAFRLMAQARHIGKIVLTLPQAAAGGCVIVSGGYGGLGPLTASWLHARGVRTIVLTGRGEPDAAAREAIARAEAAGAAIVCERMDVTDAVSVADTLRRVRQTYGPITGVVHLAGKLDDGIMLHQTPGRFAAVGAPKIAGIHNLHEQTLDDALDLFVVFSSAGAVLGSPGQAAYTAANAYLEGFIHERRRAGRPGLCVHWGPWAEAGMAARTQRRNAGAAVRAIETPAAFAALDRALDDDAVVATVLDVDWARWRELVPDGEAYPLVQHLLPARQPAVPVATNAAAKVQLAAVAPSERHAQLCAFIAGELAQVMEMDPSGLAYDQPIRDLGVDSLMALELQLRLEQELSVIIPRMALVQSPTIAGLARIIADVLNIDEPVSAPGERLKLVCFPHAGAGADAFRALARELGDDVDVVGIDYPGRGRHMTQPAATTMADLVDAIAVDVEPKLAGRVAFLGHSLGAFVAFEYARRMEAKGLRGPAVLFASSCAGPWVEQQAPPMADLDDAAFVERLRRYNGTPGRVIDDIDVMQAFLPTLRSDFAIAQTYQPPAGTTIAVPIVAVGGDSDPHVDAAALDGWRGATTSTFEAALVPGDHFHITSPAGLARTIRNALSLNPVHPV